MPLVLQYVAIFVNFLLPTIKAYKSKTDQSLLVSGKYQKSLSPYEKYYKLERELLSPS